MKISKREKILCLILILSLLIVASAFGKFVILPRKTVVADINRFDELEIGNKVILGTYYCNNTWRVEWKSGTKVLLVNEKSLQDGDFSSSEYPQYSPVCGIPAALCAGNEYNVYLDRLNGNYYNYNFGSSVKRMMCDVSPGEPFFIRAKHITWFNLTRENIEDHRSELESGDYKYYPAVWIDTSVIKSNK